MLASRDACTGCSACAQICPVGAIAMTLDRDGFLAPQVDEAACIGCEKCGQVCPVERDIERREPVDIKGYACSLRDTEEIFKSTSGGLFYALAKEMLGAGGVVFGAALTDGLRVEHMSAANESELERLRKSKYVQSNVKDTYARVKDLLEGQVPVLFSGTPCQCAGLYSYLGREYAGLVMVEVFCGQVTGELTWKRYMEYLRERTGSEPCGFEFRGKSRAGEGGQNNLGLISGGWKDPYIQVHYANNISETQQWKIDKWAIAFGYNLMQRPSCGQCKFKQQSGFNYADIAIGDFWGAENNAPQVFNANGTSAALVYSEKGEAWLRKAEKWVKLSAVDVSAIRRGNPAVWSSAKEHPNRGRFFELLRNAEADFPRALRECFGSDLSSSLKGVSFGVWGGFNIRKAVLDVCNLCDGAMAFHISNVNLISQAAAPLRQPEQTQLPPNPLRADMLKLDFDKSAFTEATGETMKNVEYLVIDFMEERFATVPWGGSYVTDSDALRDSALEVGTNPLPEEGALTELWKESCLRFIAQLKKYYADTQIILVRSLLSERYEARPGQLEDFAGEGMRRPIAEMNRILDQKYDFFLQHCATPNVITVDASRLYCEFNHKHGVAPSHSNQQSTADITKQLYALIRENNDEENKHWCMLLQ